MITTSWTSLNQCARRSRWRSPSRCSAGRTAGACVPNVAVDLNTVSDHVHHDETLDPRLAALAAWRERQDPH